MLLPRIVKGKEMKICPQCQKEYTDDGLNFCLEDGAVLTQKTDSRESLPVTVLLNQPRETNPNQTFGSQVNQPGNFSNPAPSSMQPKKSSKTWLWAVGILGLVVLLCGGGFVGFFAWVATIDTNSNTVKNTNQAANRNISGKQSPVASPKTVVSDERNDMQIVNLESWGEDFSTFGTNEYKDDEFIIGSKQKGFYYVLVAPEEYKTESANSRVSVRNVADENTKLGFGLIVHSNPTPLIQDYAFLIDSVKRKYRVVRHAPQKETTIVDWTNSPAIKGGTEKNILEVRDYADKMDFYINGELITSVKNTDAYPGGVAGIYSGDAIKAAFSDFEIRK